MNAIALQQNVTCFTQWKYKHTFQAQHIARSLSHIRLHCTGVPFSFNLQTFHTNLMRALQYK